jgi:hypothetical protein
MENRKRKLNDGLFDYHLGKQFECVHFLSNRFQYPKNFYGVGCSPLDYYKNHKFVMLSLEHCLNHHESDYVHRILLGKAQSIRTSSETPTVLLNNYTSKFTKHNDGRRVAYISNFDVRILVAKQRRKIELGTVLLLSDVDQSHFAFSKIIECMIQLVKSEGIVPENIYPTSSSGVIKTVHLLISFPGCLPQHFHYDFNPKTFEVKEGIYRGSSMFINFLKSAVTLDIGVHEGDPTKRRFITIPAMCIFVMRGDFRHAGSANNTSKELWKFFLYLDPYDSVYGGFRSANENTLYYDEDELFCIADVVKA